ncbi:MAG: peptide ABC transporter substrate-binding protein, partial [Candidatus Komeilibacteria bacterium]|nr:peptide ABC transporter substrate-binding protein [Candidatus Komeilibacteria bacterium]
NPIFSQTNSVDQDLSRLVFSSLVSFNGAGELVPDLADSYSIDDAQSVYTFTLKPNLTWHDGLPLTAADVAFTIQSIKDPNFKSPLYNTFRNVQVKLIDETTLELVLPEPFAPFLSLLTFGILPEHLWQEIDPTHAALAELNLKPIGSGPYQFSSLVKDKKGNIKEYSLKRFSNWYGQGPFIANISFKFFSTLDEAVTNVKDGNADGLGMVANTQNSELASQTDKKAYRLGLPQYTALFFNQATNAALAEKPVREALSLAINREQIIANTFTDSAKPINGPLLGEAEVIFDPSQAEAKLESAGWKKVANTDQAPYTRQKNVKSSAGETATTLEIKLTTVQKEENIQAAETIRELWLAIGVKVNLEIVDIAQIQKSIIKPRAYEVLLFGQILGGDPDPYPFWHSSQ